MLPARQYGPRAVYFAVDGQPITRISLVTNPPFVVLASGTVSPIRVSVRPVRGLNSIEARTPFGKPVGAAPAMRTTPATLGLDACIPPTVWTRTTRIFVESYVRVAM